MKEWFWNFKCMLSAKRYAKTHEQSRHEYNWFRYLVLYDINRWIDSLKFWKRKDSELPF